jgi:hypothetical protein
MPGGWAFGGTTPSAAELNTLWLNTDLLGQRDQQGLPGGDDFAPLHDRAAEPTPATTEVTITRLDAKGRLPLPSCPVLDHHLAGERDGSVLVVFLPDTDAAPRPGYDTPLLRVDARRRLLLSPVLRLKLGLAENAAVLARVDAARGVVELMAASRLEPQLNELFDAHRRQVLSMPSAVDEPLLPRLTALPGGRMHPSPTTAPSTPRRRLPPATPTEEET